MEIFQLAAEFFRSDIVRCAPNDAGTGAGSFVLSAGQAKVHKFGDAIVVEENVARFDVAMEQAAMVGGIEAGGDAGTNGEHIRFRHFTELGDAVIKAAAFKQFHHEIILATVFGEGIDLRDIVMVDGGGGARFTGERLDELRVAGKFWTEDFDSNVPVELEINAFVDGPHATDTEYIKQQQIAELEWHD